MSQSMQINLGAVEQIPVGQGRRFVIEGQDIAVFRTRNGKIFAMDDRCPHRQGPLSDGIIGDGKVVCPLHGHKLDLATGQGSEGHECVRVFKVCDVDGEIVLEYNGGENAFTQSAAC